jgi:hypothetical protein
VSPRRSGSRRSSTSLLAARRLFLKDFRRAAAGRRVGRQPAVVRRPGDGELPDTGTGRQPG